MSLQDPEFDAFKRAYQNEDFDAAMGSLTRLLRAYPQSFALRWHYAKVLEKLERYAESRQVVDQLLKQRSDFVPALVLQVQLDFHEESAEHHAEGYHPPAATTQASFELIEQRLFKILSLDPTSIDALHMLSGLLRGHEGDAHLAKANQLLNRAISLAPERIDLLEDRANSLLATAYSDGYTSSPPSPRTQSVAGVSYHRAPLEQALADFQRCYALSGQHRYGLRVGSILHDLGRFNEALSTYDQVLAHVADDDPYRPLIIERRARSENNGAGEREQRAQMLEAAVARGGKDRSLEEDTMAQTPLSTAKAVRGGKSVSEATGERLSTDRDDNMATNIAMQILNVANEPHPDLAPADAANFPQYQQKFIAKCKHDLNLLGFKHVSDAEAKGLYQLLGQNVLMSFFADNAGEIGVVCFCMKPKKPNPLTLLSLLLTGKWKALSAITKTSKMVECVSQFANGDYLNTQHLNNSPFEYGPPIYIEKLAANLSPAYVVARHKERLREYKRHFPNATAMRALDLAGMQARWLKAQTLKREYRQQIGYVTETELQNLLGEHYPRYAQKVKAKVAALAVDG